MNMRFFEGWGKYLGCGGLLAILGIIVWLYVPNLGSYPYREWDESIYAQVARESLTHPLALTWLGQGASGPENLWFEKPPLGLWLVQTSYMLFGVGEFSARLVTLLFGLATIVLVYFWARYITKSAWAGLLASASMLACFHFLLNIGILNLDIPVGFFMALALYGYSRVKDNAKYWYVFWASLALGVLTKSVVGLVPLGVVCILLLMAGTWRVAWRGNSFRYGVVLFLLMVLPWHVVETLKFGGQFWQNYLGYHVLSRFTHAIENNGNVWWYYFTIFQQIPFGLFAVGGILFGLYKVLKKQVEYLLLCLAAIIIFTLFTLAQTKGSGYIVVIYPYLAVLVGCMIYELALLLKPAWLRYVVFLSCMVLFIQVGVTYNAYRLVKMNSPVYTDLYEIADWIKGQKMVGHINYVSMNSPTAIIVGRPLLVYLTNQTIPSTAEIDLPVSLTSIYRTRTHIVYQEDDETFVVAVRFMH